MPPTIIDLVEDGTSGETTSSGSICSLSFWQFPASRHDLSQISLLSDLSSQHFWIPRHKVLEQSTVNLGQLYHINQEDLFFWERFSLGRFGRAYECIWPYMTKVVFFKLRQFKLGAPALLCQVAVKTHYAMRWHDAMQAAEKVNEFVSQLISSISDIDV